MPKKNLPGISLPDTGGNAFKEMLAQAMISLWKLNEYSNSIDKSSTLEMEWLTRIKQLYVSEISKDIALSKDESSRYADFIDWIEMSENKRRIYMPEEVADKF